MRSNITAEITELKHNLADMYIGHDAERQLMGGYFDGGYRSSSNFNGNYPTNTLDYDNDAGYYCYFLDAHVSNGVRLAMYQACDRYRLWQADLQRKRETARCNLRNKLRDTTPYRQHAPKGSWLYATRQNLNAAVKSAIKEYGNPHKMESGPKQNNAVANILATAHSCANGELYNLHNRLPNGAVVFSSIFGGWIKIEHDGTWQKPVFANERWFVNSKYYWLHCCHTSTDDPMMLAYTQSGDKAVRDIQTRVRPGRYLQQFFSDVLSEKDIRYWAERQQSVAGNSDLHFVPNTDPDGWEWVYEHASGFTSCMQYNHPSSRYLAHGLSGDNHPVRVYCHPKNDLALAYLGNKQHSDSGRVYARAIVNQDTKTWVRLYGDSRIQHALTAKGYSYGGSLEGQRLRCVDNPVGSGYLMPYLDGDTKNVSQHYDSALGEDYFLVAEDGEYDARNSNGIMEGEPETTCPCCGDSCDEDDMTYVDHLGESICRDCLNDGYTYAYGRRGLDFYPNDDVIYCETDGEFYLAEYASVYHDIYECPISERWYHFDDMVAITVGEREGEYVYHEEACELPDGEWCTRDEYDDLLEEHTPQDDDEEEVETTATTTLPAPPVEVQIAA